MVAKAAAGGAGLIIAQLQLRQHKLVLARHRDREIPGIIVIRVLVRPRLAGGEAVEVQVGREPVLRVWACMQTRTTVCGQPTGFCPLHAGRAVVAMLAQPEELPSSSSNCFLLAPGQPSLLGEPSHQAASGARRVCPALTTAASESGSWSAGGCAAAHHPRCTA